MSACLLPSAFDQQCVSAFDQYCVSAFDQHCVSACLLRVLGACLLPSVQGLPLFWTAPQRRIVGPGPGPAQPRLSHNGASRVERLRSARGGARTLLQSIRIYLQIGKVNPLDSLLSVIELLPHGYVWFCGSFQRTGET